MTPYLLDINVLLGIAWEEQQSHFTALSWFQSTGRSQFATCSITQSGFVRISSSASFTAHPMTVREAMEAMDIFTNMPGHAFWPMDMGLRESTRLFVDKLFGPQQLKDAYLLGLAIAKHGTLVTRDRAIAQLAGSALAKYVLLLP